MRSTVESFECVARPTRRGRLLGAAIVAVIVPVTTAALLAERADPLMLTVLGTCVIVVAALMAWVCLTPARLQLESAGVHVFYRPFRRFVPWLQVEEVNGVGFGYGWRWEGRGRTAVRAGGPMVTVMHSGRPLGVSVPDPDEVLAAADRARPGDDIVR